MTEGLAKGEGGEPCCPSYKAWMALRHSWLCLRRAQDVGRTIEQILELPPDARAQLSGRVVMWDDDWAALADGGAAAAQAADARTLRLLPLPGEEEGESGGEGGSLGGWRRGLARPATVALAMVVVAVAPRARH